jgi:Flp pilus assembly pilin Flp
LPCLGDGFVRLLAGFTDQSDMKLLLKQLMIDEAGGEVLEYALVAGLVVIAAIATITSVGTKVLGRWNSVKNSL